MGIERSIVADKFGGAAKSERASTNSKGSVPHEQNNIQTVQNILLIWLDNNIDENDADCRNTIIELRRAINTMNTFTDAEKCIEFIKTITNNKACMIISGSLGQRVVPRVHNMSQMDSIFIFCGNKKYHEEWAKDWPKIKGVFTDVSPICETLRKTAQQYEQDTTPISFIATNGDLSKKMFDQLEPSFMYTQILKETLLTINFEAQHVTQFINYCREVLGDNEGELENVTKFERNYRDKTAIWWYTFECFLHPMLNRSLRLMDVDIIIKMGFFISDIQRHIEQLYNEQFRSQNSNKRFTVFRGQSISKTDFDQMTKTKGGLISFNNFLSTSKDRDASLDSARRALINPDSIGILFVMMIDPSQSTTPFASIKDVGYYNDKQNEVLFAMHTVFRIGNITPMGENHRLFRVELTLTSDNDQDLCVLTERIQEETKGSTGWDRLGEILIKTGRSKQAQEFYEILLSQATNDSEKARICHQIGRTKDNLGEYEEAITFYGKSIETYKKSLPSNNLSLAGSYNNIGLAYKNIGEYSKSFSSHENALENPQQSLAPNHPDLASSYNNMGLVYKNMGEYSKALSSHEKALESQQQSLPPNHPDLAKSYNNIGNVYDNMGEYSKALSYYKKAFEIQKQSLPPNHPDIASSYNNIGNVYKNMGEYSKALSCHEKTFEIRKQSLPLNHPDLAKSYNDIGNVYYSMGDYSKAFLYYEKDFEIRKQLLPPNHPDLAKSYNDIGNVYYNIGDYSKALSYYEKALEIKQLSLPSKHLDLAKSYNDIGNVYYKMGDYSKALSYYEKELEIKQESLPPNHPDLAKSYYDIGNMYYNIGDYSKALSYYEKDLEVKQKSLPPNHPDLAKSYNSIGVVSEKMGNYSEARSFYEHAVDIAQRSLPSDHPELQKWKKHLDRVNKKL